MTQEPVVQERARPAVEVRGLGKKYGKNTIVEGVNLAVNAGEVYALTGPNGAGKTTLIRCLTGLAFPTAGSVHLLGRNVHEEGPRARAYLGAVVEAPAKFYPQFTGAQNLKIHASLARLAPSGRRIGMDRIREVLALLELTRMGDRKVGEYSLGQRQRLGVASAMLADPRVLILDEPTSGLDPLGIGLIHRIVTSLATSGCAVIMSSHHLREISSYAHTVGILSGGRLVDTVDLRARASAYRFRVDDVGRASTTLSNLPYVTKVSQRLPYVVAHLVSEAAVPDSLAKLLAEGVRVFEAAPDHFDLDAYYRERVEASQARPMQTEVVA